MDATLVALLACAGLRPGEALALRWGDIRSRTILVQNALALGEVKDTKTRRTCSVRLLAPLAADLSDWRDGVEIPTAPSLCSHAPTAQPRATTSTATRLSWLMRLLPQDENPAIAGALLQALSGTRTLDPLLTIRV